MGLMSNGIGQTVEGIGDAAEGISEVFIPNATRAAELAADIHMATLEAASAEFQHAGEGRFDRMVNGLNRLPRPLLALGTFGLFGYAMADPYAFAARMIGLQEVPEPLWWLLGAVVSFYFGARELHYARTPGLRSRARPSAQTGPMRGLRDRLGGLFGGRAGAGSTPPAAPDNPALSDWESD
ncbi:holin family protein [Gymnodinialimonas ulvae]|uniref:holin family protein n=1 Tax=Gymnodinialimonas ulvae TaxID=3126504 RepID=UPI0030A0EF48